MKKNHPYPVRFLRETALPMLLLGLFLFPSMAVPALAAPQTPAGEAALNAGIAEFKKGKFKDAKKKFQDALKADPESKKAYQYLGSTLTTLGDYNGAIKLFSQYQAKYPQDDFAYRGIAAVHLAARKFAEGLESARKAKALNPANYETDYLLACALIGLNRPYEARDAADSALKQKPDYENGLRARLQAGYRLYALRNNLFIQSKTSLDGAQGARFRAERAEIFKDNVESIQNFLRQPNAPNRQFWEKEVAGINEFASALANSVKPEGGDAADLNYQRPRILKMSAPKYTDVGRRNLVNGKVTMLVLVNEKGAVEKQLIVEGLPDGLTESAVRSATAGKFTPALRDGKPVKGVAFLEFTFRIY